MGHRISWQPEDLGNLHHEFTHVASPMVGYGMTMQSETITGIGVSGHPCIQHNARDSNGHIYARYILSWDHHDDLFVLVYKYGGITSIVDLPRWMEVA